MTVQTNGHFIYVWAPLLFQNQEPPNPFAFRSQFYKSSFTNPSSYIEIMKKSQSVDMWTYFRDFILNLMETLEWILNYEQSINHYYHSCLPMILLGTSDLFTPWWPACLCQIRFQWSAPIPMPNTKANDPSSNRKESSFQRGQKMKEHQKMAKQQCTYDIPYVPHPCPSPRQRITLLSLNSSASINLIRLCPLINP